MASTVNTPATDSARELHDLIGDDATATFEADPKFVGSNPGGEGSSENVREQARDTDDVEDSDEEVEDELDEDEEDELEDDDEEFEDDDEEDEFEDDEDDEDEDDEELEDDEDEV